MPLTSEVPLVLVVRSTGDIAWPVLVSTAGNYLGACTTYLLARAAVKRWRPPEATSHAFAIGRRFGAPALLLSWVPIIGDGLVALAGAARVRFTVFSLWVLIGKASRYTTVAWLAQP